MSNPSPTAGTTAVIPAIPPNMPQVKPNRFTRWLGRSVLRLGGWHVVGPVPDLAKGEDAVCPPTAQHAQRQGKHVADNVIATLRGEPLQPYVHKDLGLVVDLGGRDAVSKPFGVELRGTVAQAVARGYHWSALRTNVAKTRVMTNWLLNAVAGDDFVRTGFQAQQPATMRDFEFTDSYLTPEQVRAHTAALRVRE